jgi:uncharacterized protein (DUF885 family)
VKNYPKKTVMLMAALLATLSGGAPADEKAEAEAEKVNSLADRYYEYRMERNPELAYFNGVETDRHDQIFDNSPFALKRAQSQEDRMLSELGQIDATALQGRMEWVTYGFLEQALTSARDLRVCRHELWTVDQMDGWQLTYPKLAELQPVGEDQLRLLALRRWSKLPRYIDQEIANLKTGLEQGYSAPRAVVQRVIGQLDGLLALPLVESPFFSPAGRDEYIAFRQEISALVVEDIVPAMQRYRDFLEQEYLGKAREALAVTANPDGRACYEASLRSYTTLDRSPEAVFELGEQTVAANRGRVIALGKEAYGLDDFDAVIEHIKQEPEDKFKSKDELLAFSRDSVNRAYAGMSQWFGHVPRASAAVEPFPDYQDGTGVSSRYEPGAADRPGIYRITLHQPEQQGRGAAEATAFHEVWPGHHLQVSVAKEIEGLHPITQIIWYSGMGEGWARYSESLAAEMGLYTTVTGPIGRLAWPARGMVVDPGIHVMGWTREQAVAFMDDAGRMTQNELEEMVDRIAILPGQLTSYDSGGLEIFALRAMAKEKLGDKFDISEFHDRILENGTVPLSLLRQNIEMWVAAQAGE